MATNIPPHNLTEIVNACLAVLDDPEVTLAELMQHVPGPDFPTAGIINGAHRDRHRLSHRPRPPVDPRAHAFRRHRQGGGRQAIIVTELPYQVNKARLLERIADLVRDKEIDGISELRDESDKDGMRVVIELKRGEVAEVVLNNLFAQTPMETVFGINMVALHRRPAEAARRSRRCSRRSCAIAARSSRAARFSIWPRRASAPTSSKAWRSRSPTSTRSSR